MLHILTILVILVIFFRIYIFLETVITFLACLAMNLTLFSMFLRVIVIDLFYNMYFNVFFPQMSFISNRLPKLYLFSLLHFIAIMNIKQYTCIHTYTLNYINVIIKAEKKSTITLINEILSTL